MISKKRLIEIFKVTIPGQYYSDPGIWSCDIPTNISCLKLHSLKILKHSLTQPISLLSKRIVKLLVPIYLTRLKVTVFDEWQLATQDQTRVTHLNCIVLCEPKDSRNESDIWINNRTWNKTSVDIFEDFEECLSYCVERNQEIKFYGDSPFVSMIELIKQCNSGYNQVINILKKYSENNTHE